MLLMGCHVITGHNQNKMSPLSLIHHIWDFLTCVSANVDEYDPFGYYPGTSEVDILVCITCLGRLHATQPLRKR